MLPMPLPPGFYPQSIFSQYPLTHSFIPVYPRHHREKSTAPTLRKLGVRVRARRRKGSVAVL